MKKILFVLLCMIPYVTWADDTTPKKTPCATAAFEQGLRANASNISENSTKAEIEQFIMDVFSDKTTLNNVLKCSEINQKDDDAVITFDTITYEFPSKQTVTINYETQPKILRQRLSLAQKPGLPSNEQSELSALLSDDVSPDGTIWTYTDPAWYGIMVTQHGALANYVNKEIETNTISLATIKANIDTLYPKGANCTSRSAIAEDWCAINRAVTKTAGIDDPATQKNEDSNDYYVAGNINLAWVGYAEMVLDVVITVATMGGGLAISGTAKGARAARASKTMIKSLETYRKTDHVKDYVKNISNIRKLDDEIKLLDPVKDASKIADKTKQKKILEEATNIEANIKRVEKELNAANNAEDIASKQKELDNLREIQDYNKKLYEFSELNQYRRELTGITRLRNLPPQRGNIIARGVKTGSKATKTIWKSAKAAWGGTDKLNKAQKMGRASKLSTRISDRLFHFTMKNAAALGKMQSLAGTVYGGLIAAGKLMYNFTETSTGDFTNNIQFNPFLLLSADDLQEGDQADKINYGMWLMWMGDSYRPADDDAAYLQAMDFAAKFYEDLMEVQGETNSPCNVDIYVVKPIIKNPGQSDPELHYLIMNEVPWTTAQ